MISKNELKFIKTLKIKKYRLQEKKFIVEGAKNILQLIKSNYSIDLILCSSEFYSQYYAHLENVRTEIVKKEILGQVSNFKTNEQAVSIVEMPLITSEIDYNNTICMLDGVRDPGNLGTIIRTLDWFGIHQLICSEDCAELYNPKVISATMGAFIRAKVRYDNLEELILNKINMPVYGAFMEGKPLNQIILEEPCAFIMGSESHGISAPIEQLISEKITIPQIGESESLNVGIATGIIAYHLRNLK